MTNRDTCRGADETCDTGGVHGLVKLPLEENTPEVHSILGEVDLHGGVGWVFAVALEFDAASHLVALLKARVCFSGEGHGEGLPAVDSDAMRSEGRFVPLRFSRLQAHLVRLRGDARIASVLRPVTLTSSRRAQGTNR